MIIQADGRAALTGAEINAKVWEKIRNWKLDTDGRHMVPDFPECHSRRLIAICQPCGAVSALNYHCDKHNMLISVSYCKACEAKGECDGRAT
jgi:hypothetical protein